MLFLDKAAGTIAVICFSLWREKKNQQYATIRCLLLKPFDAGIIFLILAHSIYKMWILQEPNMLELWNKLHFEEEKMESV